MADSARPDPTVPAVAEASAAQRRAASPLSSAWVSANAGSGKTRVLTERVARLLLAGADPARILCLTYTRAAAAEMANRLAALLGRWALMPEAELRAALLALDDDITAELRGPLTAEAIAQARRLFAKALETPGGLKIQTIHAFCAAALRRFPLEAGVSPDFSELDAPESARLVERALDRLAAAAEAGSDTAFDGVAAHLGEEALPGLCAAVLSRRALFRSPPAPAALCQTFGVDVAAIGSDPLRAWWAAFDRDTARRAVEAFDAGNSWDGWVGKPLRRALEREDVAALQDAFYNSKGEGRDFAKVPTKKVAAAHPWLRDWIAATADSWQAAKTRADAVAAAERALALNAFGAAFLRAYEAEKRARAALDFDDLVDRALALIGHPETGPWALYKLDGGIDHLLVDEAQDTSPPQWALIEALTAEFHAGEGTRRGRTLFVVGDEKQSIYSFQGAEPRLFGESRLAFAERMRAARAPLLEIDLPTSFRASPAILRAVDTTFEAAPEGLSARGTVPMHLSAWPGRPGRVDLWPIIGRDEAEEDPPWDEPLDAPPPDDPRLRLARIVAAEIARWVETGTPLPGAGRAVRPGDVLVLVRRRDRLAAEIVRSLKRRGVAVAGADRIRVAEELAVRDLLAAARFALTPGDDLSLAAVLRSPLCGLTEEGLFALAHGRTVPLWARLRAAPEHAAVAGFLAAMRDRADFLRPFEFFDAILTRDGGRHRLLARLGIEAEDAVDELLAQALVYESTHTPTLEGFLDWLGRAGVEIRREQDKGEGTVRVMTVHGAKGLESPIVIVPDTVASRLGRPPDVVPVPVGSGVAAAWRMPKDDTPPLLAAADALREQRAREESRRLLYVAMTRAERWLILAGAGSPGKGETWHALAEAGLRAGGAVECPAPAGLEGPMLRLGDGDATPVARPETGRDTAATLPPWTTTPPAPAPVAAPRRAASALGETAGEAVAATAGTPPSATDRATARRRGTAIHSLLEHLPALAPAARQAAALRLLQRLVPDDAADHAAWAAEALAALAVPEAAVFFAPGSLAEVALSWQPPGGGGRIAGRVDRMVVDADGVALLDIKTDESPPPATPEPYLRQMAAYTAALAQIYPDRPISAALLWTASGRVVRLDPAALAAARATLA